MTPTHRVALQRDRTETLDDGSPASHEAGVHAWPQGLQLALTMALALTGVAAAVLVVALASGAPGGSQAAVDVSGPAEPLTRWGLPVARTLRDLTSAGVVGLLVLAAVASARPGIRGSGRHGDRLAGRC